MQASKIIEKIINERGALANIHDAYREFPEGMEAHYDFYSKVMLGENLPLNRKQREWLAVETSRSNKCPYCIAHHEEALEKMNSPLSEEEKNIFSKLASILTIEPWKAALIKKEFLAQKFSEAQWSHAVMIVSYFNMANRIAFGMDLELEENYHHSCN